MGDHTRRSLKIPLYGKVSKTCPHKMRFTGNFTQQQRHFDILPERDSMRQDILNSVMKRTESIMMEHRDSDGVNPMYEDPRDVIGDKPPKPPRKRNIQGLAVASPRSSKEGRSLLKEQKRKLTKKYEGLITALMDKCEEHAIVISEKESHIMKLKEKLKAVLEYNRLFADENDRLRAQHNTLVSYTEDCKSALKEQQEILGEMEKRCKKLEEKVKQYEIPDREKSEPSTAIPLVEVCMSCSSRQILLQQARDQNCRLQKDMQGLKDVLYRLNVQLSRYQEKIRSNVPGLASDLKGDHHRFTDKLDGFDSLITASFGQRQDVEQNEESPSSRTRHDDDTHATRLVDLSGLLSAQALAPLFDAYQDNLQEKDNLILDYEKQFENMNKKSKQIVTENKSLNERIGALEVELVQVRQSYKRVIVEKETADIEKITLVERAEKAESKLKEVYELYEDKMAAMARDYETVHREYYAARSALDACAGRAARAVTAVPAELHERRLDHCKRLLEELKHQYGMESERRMEQLHRVQEQLRSAQEQEAKLREEREALREQLAAALANVKLYRKAAVVFRRRAQAAAARATRVSRGKRRSAGEPLRRALQALEKIKIEIKAVKSRAHSSLEELERRIVQREKRAAHAQAECRRELERAALALQHKEGIIRSLIDKVADVEEVRLSQTNTHRLQGIVSDSSPDRSDSPKHQEKEHPKTSVKLVPGPGGYFQERESKRKSKS